MSSLSNLCCNTGMYPKGSPKYNIMKASASARKASLGVKKPSPKKTTPKLFQCSISTCNFVLGFQCSN